ncbi:HNH endonuclease [Cryobacterium sp. Hh7]|nr:HNH endonuclease [Cryobacterium sp. Hh7]
MLEHVARAGGYQPVLFGHQGQVVHLGPTNRFFTTTQRRALAARDGGCVIPGCTVPPHLTQAHHVIAWSKGGLTNIDNVVLICNAGHASIETSGWDIDMRHGRPWVRGPLIFDPTTASFSNDPAPSALLVFGYVDSFVRFALALVAAMQIAGAGAVPTPWIWVPAWVAGAASTSWLFLAIVSVGATERCNIFTAFLLSVDGLARVGGTVLLGVLAIVLADRARRPTAALIRAGPWPEH